MLVKGSIEDFLYIIVGVIWIAFSIYKGMQKKKSQQPTPTDDYDNESEPLPEKKKTAFESFINEIMEVEEPDPYQPVDAEPEPEATPITTNAEKKVFSYDDYYEESNYKERFGVYEEAETQSKELNQKLNTSLKKSRKPRFNLRKAIVYSEILNRRYF